jgi:cation diffusion facilitator CzcD-associated flavoprotein CzcO
MKENQAPPIKGGIQMQNADKSAVSSIAPINTDVDVLVVGAGFSGLYAMHKLRDELGLLVQGFETADGVGGTWYWNRYPGARCDSAGSVYCFTFNQDIINEWTWSEKYPAQPEILRYLNFVADKLDLKRSFRFSTRIESMTWDEATNHWEVRTNDGDVVHARYVISAVGCLSASNKANFKGMGNFTGESYHTAQWPHHPVSFAKQRVAVIGTGSTAIQAIPVIAEDAAHLTIFQPTPNFSTPAKNYALTPQEQQRYREEAAALHDRIKRTFAGQDLEQIQKSAKDDSPEERKRNFDKLFEAGDFSFWLANYQDVLSDPESNELAAEYLRDRIRQTVRNPAVAEKLVPRSYPYGTKRQALDTNYYETFNRDNVSLVDVNEDPIEEITPKGIRTRNGEHEFDIVVYALGFDAITGPINRMRIVGRGGEVLSEKWKDGARNYLGLSVAGFPNFFTVTGPGSPSVLSNMPVSIEQHVEWIVGAIQYAEEHGIGVIEARPDAEAEWTGHVNDVAAATLFPRAASWYMGANVPGKPRVFMPYIGGVGTYREKCDDDVSSNYKGFDLIRG